MLHILLARFHCRTVPIRTPWALQKSVDRHGLPLWRRHFVAKKVKVSSVLASTGATRGCKAPATVMRRSGHAARGSKDAAA